MTVQPSFGSYVYSFFLYFFIFFTNLSSFQVLFCINAPHPLQSHRHTPSPACSPAAMLVSTFPSIRGFFKKITILKYYLFGLGEGYTLTTGTPMSIDVWIAAARHSFCLFLHFFKYENAVNNDKLSSSSKLSNFKDKSKRQI